MSHHHKLSLRSAIFININIMLGSGIFINTTILSQKAGILGSLSYLCIGILMLPLILSMTQLLKLHPSGGFYVFAQKEIHPIAGFISSWSYFIGKLGSAVVIIHIAMLLLQQIIPFLAQFDVLTLDSCTILLFIILNLLDIKTSSSIQTGFLILKFIPIFFGSAVALYLFSPSNMTGAPIEWSQFPLTLPLVLFAIAGFEAACSLSSRIKDAEKNAPKAILISYGFVIGATTLFQFAMSGALGSLLAQLPDYRFVFPTLFFQAFQDHTIQKTATDIVHLAIASSALGAAYGVIFSNVWNVYALVEHGHLPLASRLGTFNRFHIPWLCVLLEGVICFLYLFVSRGSQIPLQQIGALGPSIGYSLSALSMIFALKNPANTLPAIVPYLALINCMALIAASIYGLVMNGIYSLGIFSALMACGIGMFYATRLTNFNSNKG